MSFSSESFGDRGGRDEEGFLEDEAREEESVLSLSVGELTWCSDTR